MAQELRVGSLLEGQVFRAGQRLRVTLQLTNPRTIESIWSNSYDMDLQDDPLKALDDVIRQVTSGIREAVTGTKAP